MFLISDIFVRKIFVFPVFNLPLFSCFFFSLFFFFTSLNISNFYGIFINNKSVCETKLKQSFQFCVPQRPIQVHFRGFQIVIFSAQKNCLSLDTVKPARVYVMTKWYLACYDSFTFLCRFTRTFSFLCLFSS